MRVLIADSGKASLVMTSEIFKDQFPGVHVTVARTSEEVIDIVKNNSEFDAVVIDFDLPDRDGAWTAARVKKMAQVPILMTAFDRPEVGPIIEKELAGYDDCLSWLRKPVRSQLVVEIVRRYCEGKYRTQRRVPYDLPAIFELAVRIPIGSETSEPISKKPARGKGKAPPPTDADLNLERTISRRIRIPAVVRDVSLGGLNLMVTREMLTALTLAESATRGVDGMQIGQPLNVILPTWDDIVAQRRLSHRDLTAEIFEQKKTSHARRKEGPSHSPHPEKAYPALRGKVAWTRHSKNLWSFGFQSDNHNTSRRLFDIIVENTIGPDEENKTTGS